MLPVNTADETFNTDATVLNNLGQLIFSNIDNASCYLLPAVCQMKAAYNKARNQMKKRFQVIPSLITNDTRIHHSALKTLSKCQKLKLKIFHHTA